MIRLVLIGGVVGLYVAVFYVVGRRAGGRVSELSLLGACVHCRRVYIVDESTAADKRHYCCEDHETDELALVLGCVTHE